MGARPGGKFKAGTYMVAALLSLVQYSTQVMTGDAWGTLASLSNLIAVLTQIAYVVMVLATIASFVDYFIQFLKIYQHNA